MVPGTRYTSKTAVMVEWKPDADHEQPIGPYRIGTYRWRHLDGLLYEYLLMPYMYSYHKYTRGTVWVLQYAQQYYTICFIV